MSVDRFQELLSELGKIFHMPLHPDDLYACSLQIGPLTIQLELDPTQQELLLFTKVAELPPGKFRENILCETLKHNNLPDPRPGTFGYLAKTNHLALFQRYPLPLLTGDLLANLFGAFYELGSAWHLAIQNGQTRP